MAQQLDLFTAETSFSQGKETDNSESGDLSPPYVEPSGSKDRNKEATSSPAVMESVIERLPMAFDKVQSNRGAPGPDRQDIDMVKRHFEHVRRELASELRAGTYRPGMTRRVWIPKPDGSQRPLGIPNVVDRIVQTAVAMVLEPKCEVRFHSSSHGFRPGRSCHTAIREAVAYVSEGYGWVVDIDLEKFFDQVHHQRLMARLATIEPDYELLKLVGLMLKAKTLLPDGLVQANERGVPQGGPLSALLSNIVLDELDHELSRRGHKFVRYADDCKIYVRSERAGQRVMESMSHWITRKLRLRVNEGKSAVARPRERHFVGFRLENNDDEEVEIRLSKRSLERVRRKVVELTPRNWGGSLDSCIERLNSYLNGWFGFFGIVGAGELRTLQSIDAHIRRRLRAIMLKQWKRKRTIARKLISMGGSRAKVWGTVYEGRHNLWALSSCPIVNSTIRNAFFERRGLRSLYKRWLSKHPTITASGQPQSPAIP